MLSIQRCWMLYLVVPSFVVLSPLSSLMLGQVQEDQTATVAKGKALIDEAYAKTRAATTVAELSEVLDFCNRARQSNLTEGQVKYLEQLASWVFNRRGELYADQAAQFATQGEKEQAAAVDAKALADFEAAVQNDPTRWQAVHNRGVSYATAGRLQEALQDFTNVTRLRSDYPKGWFNLGETYYLLGQFDAAVDAYSRMTQLAAADSSVYVRRGHAHFQRRRFREALADYDRAVRLNPTDGETLANRADANQSLGRWRQAADDYRRAIELNDNLARAYQSAAWLMATCPDANFRNSALALESAQTAIKLSGEDDFRCLDTLAAAQANAGKFDDAKAILAKAIDLAPLAERDSLTKRMKVYEDRQPYRQGMFRNSQSAE